MKNSSPEKGENESKPKKNRKLTLDKVRQNGSSRLAVCDTGASSRQKAPRKSSLALFLYMFYVVSFFVLTCGGIMNSSPRRRWLLWPSIHSKAAPRTYFIVFIILSLHVLMASHHFCYNISKNSFHYNLWAFPPCAIPSPTATKFTNKCPTSQPAAC